MVAAALTTRVRLMAVCDGVRESKTEAGVYHLKGVRQGVSANTFPFVPVRLWLFLVLSSLRPGCIPFTILSSALQHEVHNMESKGRKVARKSTLQVFKVIPITDPAEQAELYRRCNEAEKAFATAARNAGKQITQTQVTAPDRLRLCSLPPGPKGNGRRRSGFFKTRDPMY